MTETLVFGAADYSVFAIMLSISLGIGIYFGVKDRGKKNVQNYLMGNRQMNPYAVGMSLSFSFLSAVTILGIPSELYVFGSMYVWLLGSLSMVFVVVTSIYIPLYTRLEITSSYEYLNLRFNYALRVVGTLAYIAQTVLYIGVMIYAPSLAFAQVSGFSLWAAIFTTGIVCTIYTTLGGLKAVIWTDVFQGVVIMIILLIILFMSAASIGGWEKVYLANSKTDRFEFFVFDLDPRVRHSFWSVVIGLGFLWTSIFGTTQSQVQRYLACATAKAAITSTIVCFVAAIFVTLICFGLGWVMYAYFEGCDPFFSGQVTARDQFLPLMVMRLFQNAPGVSGAFLASVYAAALSTVSSGINAMSCVTTQDFIRPFVKWRESTMTIVAKVLVFAYGLLGIGFACLSTVLGNILQTSLSLLGILAGPSLGIYTLGIVFPFANSPGALSGFVIGLVMITWIYIGSLSYPPPLLQFARPKFVSVAQCAVSPALQATVNYTSTIFDSITTIPITSDPTSSNFTTVPVIAPEPRPPIADLYAVSYAYYTAIGMVATLISGVIISLATGGHKHVKDVDPKLVTPLLDHAMFRYCLPKKFRKIMWCGVDHESKDDVRARVFTDIFYKRIGKNFFFFFISYRAKFLQSIIWKNIEMKEKKIQHLK